MLIVAHSEDDDERIRIINARPTTNAEMRPEYDLRGGVRGKYYERYQQGTNVVLLDPDIADVFKDSLTVNIALRQFLTEHGEPPDPSRKGGLTSR